jgi:Uma2 family endonuclease
MPVPILDRPGRADQLWPLTVEAYHALGEAGLIPEKTELLHGFVFQKTPKSPLHTRIVELLVEWLRATIVSGLIVRQEQPLSLQDSEPEPDLAVVRGQRADFYQRHPATAELVIEVAITTQDYDRDKATAYASAGISEFWIVLVPEQQIEVYREPEAGEYRSLTTISMDAVLSSSAVPGFEVAVSELLDVPVA